MVADETVTVNKPSTHWLIGSLYYVVDQPLLQVLPIISHATCSPPIDTVLLAL